jgi:hypothetical protein
MGNFTMKKIAPEKPIENWTKFPNNILDNIEIFSPSEFKVLSFMIRKNLGYSNPDKRFSISYLVSKLNMSKQTVVKSVKDLLEKESIIDIEKGQRGTSRYDINWTAPKLTSQKNRLVKKIDKKVSKNHTRSSLKIRQDLVQNLDTVKESNNKRNQTIKENKSKREKKQSSSSDKLKLFYSYIIKRLNENKSYKIINSSKYKKCIENESKREKETFNYKFLSYKEQESLKIIYNFYKTKLKKDKKSLNKYIKYISKRFDSGFQLQFSFGVMKFLINDYLDEKGGGSKRSYKSSSKKETFVEEQPDISKNTKVCIQAGFDIDECFEIVGDFIDDPVMKEFYDNHAKNWNEFQAEFKYKKNTPKAILKNMGSTYKNLVKQMDYAPEAFVKIYTGQTPTKDDIINSYEELKDKTYPEIKKVFKKDIEEDVKLGLLGKKKIGNKTEYFMRYDYYKAFGGETYLNRFINPKINNGV